MLRDMLMYRFVQFSGLVTELSAAQFLQYVVQPKSLFLCMNSSLNYIKKSVQAMLDAK